MLFKNMPNNNIDFLVIFAYVVVVLFGTPWLFAVSVVAITNPTLSTWQVFKEAKRRLVEALAKVGLGILLLGGILLAFLLLILTAAAHGWIRVVPMP